MWPVVNKGEKVKSMDRFIDYTVYSPVRLVQIIIKQAIYIDFAFLITWNSNVIFRYCAAYDP